MATVIREEDVKRAIKRADFFYGKPFIEPSDLTDILGNLLTHEEKEHVIDGGKMVPFIEGTKKNFDSINAAYRVGGASLVVKEINTILAEKYK